MKLNIWAKFKEYWRRYRYPEIISTIVFLLFNLLSFREELNDFHYSIIVVIVEYVSYYGVVLLLALANAYSDQGRVSLKSLTTSLLKEFAPAAIFDFMIARPACIWYFSSQLDSSFLSIVLGSLTADLLFYFLTICCLETWVKPSSSRDYLSPEYLLGDHSS